MHGHGVTLAFIDSAFYPHCDLISPRNRIRGWADVTKPRVELISFRADRQPRWPGWNALSAMQWHGLMTTVVAAGNGFHPGIASEANLLLLHAANRRSRITDRTLVRALRWLRIHGPALGVRVVNISVHGDAPATPGNAVDEAASALVNEGITVIGAIGNSSDRRLLPPASCPDVISVGGLDERNCRTIWHSSYGRATDGSPKPELVAPAAWVVSPILPGTPKQQEAAELFSRGATREMAEKQLISPDYQYVDGTSVASAIVAATVASMIEANPRLTAAALRQCLTRTCDPVCGAPPERQGYGALNSPKAIAAARAATPL